MKKTADITVKTIGLIKRAMLPIWVFFLSVPARIAIAAEGAGSSVLGQPAFDPPIGPKTFAGIISVIVDVVIQVGTIVVIMAIIYSGFLFVTAQGNDAKLEKAKSTFFWVIIGAIVLLGANQLAGVVETTVDQFK